MTCCLMLASADLGGSSQRSRINSSLPVGRPRSRSSARSNARRDGAAKLRQETPSTSIGPKKRNNTQRSPIQYPPTARSLQSRQRLTSRCRRPLTSRRARTFGKTRVIARGHAEIRRLRSRRHSCHCRPLPWRPAVSGDRRPSRVIAAARAARHTHYSTIGERVGGPDSPVAGACTPPVTQGRSVLGELEQRVCPSGQAVIQVGSEPGQHGQRLDAGGIVRPLQSHPGQHHSTPATLRQRLLRHDLRPRHDLRFPARQSLTAISSTSPEIAAECSDAQVN